MFYWNAIVAVTCRPCAGKNAYLLVTYKIRIKCLSACEMSNIESVSKTLVRLSENSISSAVYDHYSYIAHL